MVVYYSDLSLTRVTDGSVAKNLMIICTRACALIHSGKRCSRALLAIFIAFIWHTTVIASVANWSGDWDTRWRGGGARLSLTQEGDQVQGVYPLYDGKISAVASGRELRGQWFQGGTAGEFLAIQSPDGQTFTARLGTAQWWTGLRASQEGKTLGIAVDQSSPASTVYHFLLIMNSLGQAPWNSKAKHPL